jgi:hypothetical protein
LVLVRLVDPLGKRATEATAVASALTLALTLAGCGTTTSPSKANNSKASRAPLPQALIAQARPVGRGPQFHPPVTGPILGLCLPSLGPRYQVHLELFRANRVVLIGTGIGVRGPARLLDGRIIKARCYGALATLDPTGVLLIRTGTSVTLGQAFRSWGVPLHGRLYVNGRRVTGIEPATLKLTPDAEVVLEQGPYVPPHHSYRFPPVTSWR